MLSLFSFKGRMGRLPYALWSLGVFGSQYLVLMAASRAGYPPHGPLWLVQGRDWVVYIVPFRSMVEIAGRVSDIALLVLLGYVVAVAWALAALAFRRAADANFSSWSAAWAITPVVQIPIILLLCVIP